MTHYQKLIEKLKTLEADGSGYAVSPDKIKQIVDETSLIEIEYRFPAALDKMIRQHKKYAMFIVDRNLSETEYDFEEVNAIDPAFNELQYDKFFEREGGLSASQTGI